MMRTMIFMNRSNGKFHVQIRLAKGFIFFSEEYDTGEVAEDALKTLIEQVKLRED